MKQKVYLARAACLAVLCTVLCMVILAGCSGSSEYEEQENITEQETQTALSSENQGSKSGDEAQDDSDWQDKELELFNEGQGMQVLTEDGMLETQIIESKPLTVEIDWSEHFGGLQGAAVLYDESLMQRFIYNYDLAMTQRSPCSTFKIISSLIALEHGIIDPEDSTRAWSGEVFWNENWNRDIDFRDAFRDSCVWYFRQVTDEIGEKKMQKGLDQLQYGNCDISDWEGQLNTNSNNRALTGFWLESSLLISPYEQTEVMERVFGPDSVYKKKTRNELKRVMLVQQDNEDVAIYGKTGMGMAGGAVVDAWFTGFAEHENDRVYFCVYLGQTDDQDVTSTAAKEIAIQIVLDYYY